MSPSVHSIRELPAQLILRSLLEYPDESEDRNGESPERKATKDDKTEGIVDVSGLASALLHLDFTDQLPVDSEEDNQPEQDPPPSRDSQSEQDPVGEDNLQHIKPLHFIIPLIQSRFNVSEYRDPELIPSDYSNDADDESEPSEEEISSEGSEKPRQGWNETNRAKQNKRGRRNGFSDQCPTKCKLNPDKSESNMTGITPYRKRFRTPQ